MKTLTLIRHAKSSWDDSSRPDKERTLNRRGMRDAPVIGERLSHRASKPQLILSSPAIRAIETARIIAGHVDYPISDIIVLDALYAATVATLRKIVEALDDNLSEVYLIGHNPGLSEFAADLSSNQITEMPTCSVVIAQVDSSKWHLLSKGFAEHIEFYKPKDRS